MIPTRLRLALIEAWNYGQFSDDFNLPLAKKIRKDLRELCSVLAGTPQPAMSEERSCPHCGLTVGQGYGGTPQCRQSWGGSSQSHAEYLASLTGCILKTAATQEQLKAAQSSAMGVEPVPVAPTCPRCHRSAGNWEYRLVHNRKDKVWNWRCDCGYESPKLRYPHDANGSRV